METVNTTTAALEAIDVDVVSTWSRAVTVRGVNWRINAGEFWVIGGSHGAGKTDLLMTMAGLHKPAGGALRICGVAVAELPDAEHGALRQKIGFVFKNGGRMFNELTVAENIALGLCYHKNWTMEEASDAVHGILDLMELGAVADETAQSLGVYWQQRVGLGRALALKPEILFLDEPAAGLETRHRLWWQKFIDRLHAGTVPGIDHPVTVVIAATDFSSWRADGHRYALIKDREFIPGGENSEPPEID